MTIETQWTELEREARDHADAGWRLRLARPVGGHPLFVAVASGRRHLMLRTARADIPPRADWPDCAGLELLAIELEGHAYLGVALREPRFADVFAALAEDLANRLDAAPPIEAVSVFVGRLARWRRFLAAAGEGLGGEAQRGLWGELCTLLDAFVSALGGSAAVAGWRGPDAAHQDFHPRRVGRGEDNTRQGTADRAHHERAAARRHARPCALPTRAYAGDRGRRRDDATLARGPGAQRTRG